MPWEHRPVARMAMLSRKIAATFGRLTLVIATIAEAAIRAMFFSNKFAVNRSGTIICATKDFH